MRIRALTLTVAAVAAGTAALAACNPETSTSSSGGSKSSSTSSSSGSTQLGPLAHASDVKITGCTTDATLNMPVAHLTVTNPSSKPSDYMITIAFEDTAGNQIDTGTAVVNSLQPGQATKTDANSFKSGANTTGMTCKVVQADRTSAVG
jgi:hypothetical protein